MAEHADLIHEMPYLEKLNTEERLKLARKRRGQQLKKWSQREKEYSVMNRRKRSDAINAAAAQAQQPQDAKKNGYKVHFVPSVMLLEAATRNDVDEVKRLLMLGVSPDSTNEDGLTALHQCCIDNCEDMMRLLIEFGANVNAKDTEQWTPLHAAATCGHLHLIKLLIEKEADLLAVNADGNMPYDICEDEQTLDYIEAEMAKRGITQELIDQIRVKTEQQMLFDMREMVKKGYAANYRDEQGATPLHIAAANGYMNVIEFLVDNNVPVDDCDNDLWQPIHAAACWGHIDVVEYLVQNGADLEARTKNGETPFDICEDPDMKNRILQLKSEIESRKTVSSTRLKRSHSTNTRTHSIRRTSIREKSQIAKREAIEEARSLWQEKGLESVDTKKDDTDVDSETQFSNEFNRKLLTDSPIDTDSIKVKMNSNGRDHYPYQKPTNDCENGSNHNDLIEMNHEHLNSNSQPRLMDPKIDYLDSGTNDNHDNYHSKDTSREQNVIVPRNEMVDTSVIDSSSTTPMSSFLIDPSYGLTNNNNNNGASGTLIDLKKQRSEKHRNSLSTAYTDRMKPPSAGAPSDQFAGGGGGGANTSGAIHYLHQNTNNKPSNLNQLSYPHPLSHHSHHHHGGGVDPGAIIGGPTMVKLGIAGSSTADFDSPNAIRKKFRGNPSELIGEDEKKGCCIIC